jgi:II/X family phage/plasmid replication protein
MIDWLTLNIPFDVKYLDYDYDFSTGKPVRVAPYPLALWDLGIPLQANYDHDIELIDSSVRHPWESVPSNYSGMATKVVDFRNMNHPRFFVLIQGSPAKLMQGHNIYGSDNLELCSSYMLDLLCKKYPVMCSHLDFRYTKVDQMDITFFSRADTNAEARQFIDFLSSVSKGHTKARTAYKGQTVYFGKQNSRIRKLKVYFKLDEVEDYKQKLEKKGTLESRRLAKIYTPELLEFCDGMIRWEASLKSRWFERRGISNYLKDLIKSAEPVNYWHDAFSDIIEGLRGKELKMINDEQIQILLRERFFTVSDKTGKISYTKASTCFRTYCFIKDRGFNEAKQITPARTFYRSLDMLEEIGIGRAMLQNLTSQGFNNIVPMVRYITIDFGAQYPSNFDLSIYEKIAAKMAA